MEEIARVLGIDLKDLISFDEKTVFMNNIASPNSHNYIYSQDCKHALEKANLLLEKKDKEIDYLKEIIDLLKQPNKG